MADLEKVIKGLESELLFVNDFGDCSATKSDCPYAGINCHSNLMKDAITVLKEQEKAIKYRSDRLIELLKAQEAIPPRRIDGKRNHFLKCGGCNSELMSGMKYCSQCGKKVKWGG